MSYHWFVRTDLLNHPLHGEVLLISRFGKTVAIHHTTPGEGTHCYTGAAKQFFLRSMGVTGAASAPSDRAPHSRDG